ncbi:hypothetical protein AURDEDRAFT_152935 [Auricularia subglabra TFB-10046 SS5]|nr:hypothetical protein AURDEDRAFT_152935 [Auricularia subglabra TFB-10046 SS5]
MSSEPPATESPSDAPQAPPPEPTPPAPPQKETLDSVLERARAAHASGDAEHDALGEMISWVQQLSGQLATAFRERAEMETSLTLTRSNLQMAIANNEMLEDALRNRGTSRDVGWRRSRPPGDPILEASASTSTPPNSAAFPASPNPPTPHHPPPPAPQKEGRFLSRFRFGGSSSPQQQSSPVSPRPPGHSHSVDDASFHPGPPSSNGANHLTSASLPYLPLDPPQPQPPRTRLESAPSLRAELQKERAARAAIEAELESLSAALFEEANKMVADERRSKAEIMEELRTVSQQRDALKAALRVVEQENGVLRGGEWTPAHSRPGSVASRRGDEDDAPTPPTHFSRDDIRPRSASLASVRSIASNGSAKHKPTPLKETPRAPQASEPDRESEDGDSDDGERREDGYQVLAHEHVVDDLQTPRVNGSFVHAQ